MPQRFDIAVAGAGMVGACAALALANTGFRVALVEPAESEPKSKADDEAYDLRVSALSPTSQQILQQLGVWQGLDQNRICQYEKMFIWHQYGHSRVEFDCVELARESLGAIVENNQIVRALQSVCDARTNIEWFRPDRIDSIEENSEKCLKLILASGTELEPDLLIAADGRGSSTRQLAGFDVIGGDYQQQAIVANVNTEFDHQFTAWQRFLSTGPLAFLPLANGQSSIVWSCDNDFADDMMSLDDSGFCRALGDAFEGQLGRVERISQRQSFPLSWHSSERWLNNRVLLLGDAAHGVHPLAGQGVNLGFSDVGLLAQKIGGLEDAWNSKKLRQFERQRKSETALATHAFSALKSIYGLDHPAINQLRDLGMQVVQNSPVVRRLLMKQAMRNMA
ncbi:MAG: UbiH/UbiF/VisC/COQ6 family ubiquinone biosynthesis hydroxylase [Gammaproteobacteria bacterium]|nr:UbiH/UbiF/VisC/COQ6 family ubiquinone biosynthesis hydroxylase [Gammaproteobacteria bacterium]